MRSAGILLPISSLPSKYGIGTIGKEAFAFIDFLKKSGQKYWQILPIGPTGFGNSPYQSVSSFAGNPFFIDIDILVEKGLLTQNIVDNYDFGNDCKKIDYQKLVDYRLELLKQAVEAFDKLDASYLNFVRKNSSWLKEYALFMAVKEKFDMKPLKEWDEEVRLRKPKVLKLLKDELSERIEFFCVIQYFFFWQWDDMKKYAKEKGISIIGDIPIYVSPDSAELWAQPELFQVDDKKKMTGVAGCPPDAFTEDGQLWGNPLYDWDYHIKTDFKWWKSRLRHCRNIYDGLRIDHFRGFESYYSIKANAVTARKGKWVKGPSLCFIDMLKKDFKNYFIIAEDLGFLTQEVKDMLAYSEFPGMKVLQFAFNKGHNSEYLPHNHIYNSVVYTGTHDNATTVQWAKEMSAADLGFACDYLSVKKCEKLASVLVKTALASVAETCIIPLQDYLGFDAFARVNLPGTVQNNWEWRVEKKNLTKKLQKKIKDKMKLYFR